MSGQNRPEDGLSLTDTGLNIQGDDPTIPDEGIEAAPPDLGCAAADTDSERTVDGTLPAPLEGGVADGLLGTPREEFKPDDPCD
jgi:hypothetical protein